MGVAAFDGILSGFRERPENVIPVLQEIQTQFHFLPEEALRAVSRRFKIPLTQVFQVATFYNCFSLEPRGHHQVEVCVGTACHIRGGQRILDRVLRESTFPPPAPPPITPSACSRRVVSGVAPWRRSCASTSGLTAI